MPSKPRKKRIVKTLKTAKAKLDKMVAKGKKTRDRILKEYEKVQIKAAEYDAKRNKDLFGLGSVGPGQQKDLLGLEEFQRRHKKKEEE